MERTKINELDTVDTPVHRDEDKARLIGEIIADSIAELGSDRAMTPDAFVRIAPALPSGSGRQGRSVATQSKAFGIHAITARTDVSSVENGAALQQFIRGIRS